MPLTHFTATLIIDISFLRYADGWIYIWDVWKTPFPFLTLGLIIAASWLAIKIFNRRGDVDSPPNSLPDDIERHYTADGRYFSYIPKTPYFLKRPVMPEHLESYELWEEYIIERQPVALPTGQSGKKYFPRRSKVNIELLKAQYETHINLYEKYLDLLIKLSIFNFAVVGAILSFYFTHIEMSVVRWALIFPMLMNGFFALLTFVAYWSLERINREVSYMAALLSFLPPGIETLRQSLLITFTLLILIIGGLSIVFDMYPLTSGQVANDSMGQQKQQIETIQHQILQLEIQQQKQELQLLKQQQQPTPTP